jgi:hypothetical protein
MTSHKIEQVWEVESHVTTTNSFNATWSHISNDAG